MRRDGFIRHGDDGGVLTHCIRSGLSATAATTLAAAVCGKIETGSAMMPINAVSHILWGDEASDQDDASPRYTITGLLLNSAAVTSWAAVHDTLLRRRRRDGLSLIEALLGGVCVSGLAFFTDYFLVPKRFTPGFEKCLSNSSLLVIYAALAAGLGANDVLNVLTTSETTTRL